MTWFRPTELILTKLLEPAEWLSYSFCFCFRLFAFCISGSSTFFGPATCYLTKIWDTNNLNQSTLPFQGAWPDTSFQIRMFPLPLSELQAALAASLGSLVVGFTSAWFGLTFIFWSLCMSNGHCPSFLSYLIFLMFQLFQVLACNCLSPEGWEQVEEEKIILRFSTLKIPLLSSTKNPLRLKVSDSDASWIGSLMPLAALVGGLLGGLALHRLGRKVRDGSRYQIGWIFEKVPKGGGGIFNPKIYVADFGNFK